MRPIFMVYPLSMFTKGLVWVEAVFKKTGVWLEILEDVFPALSVVQYAKKDFLSTSKSAAP